MKLIISPKDTLNFGRGKPSTKGEDSFLAEMFPPYPSVLLGAFRGSYLSLNPDAIAKANKPADPTRNFSIMHYSLLLDNEPHFPAPADYVWQDDIAIAMKLVKNDGLSSLNLPYCLHVNHSGKIREAGGKWISIKALNAYLSNKHETMDSKNLSDFCERETHVGISRNIQTRTAQEHMLYNVTMTRAQNLKFAIELDTKSETINDKGLLRLGSHNKTAKYEAVNFDSKITGQVGKIFKLYLATPAIFKQGWKPDIEERYGIELVAAAVSGYECIGGYDIKANKPKPMRRAVKAGSVYYYKLQDDRHKSLIIENLHGVSISEERANEGFGLSYIGKWEGEY